MSRAQNTKQGVAAIYVVVFTTMLIGIITLSFLRIMLSESGRTLNDTLSDSAYNAALAGVEDAKFIVEDMYHFEQGKKHTGEYFDMHKAKEVCEKYKEHFVVKATPCDVYVAINAFYHDFCKVLKSWFGSNIDEKVILLAVTFWFKDDDYQGNRNPYIDFPGLVDYVYGDFNENKKLFH